MDVPVCDSLRHEPVILKSRDAQSGSVFLEADDNKLVATKGMAGFTSVFKMITAADEDGQLAALQVEDKYFLTPKKPKDISRDSQLKLRPKEIKRSKIFDKKDSEIESKSRKYWFRVKTVSSAQVYESLAYKGFYMSVEGKRVLMRKCSEDLPDDPNYHIYVMPPSDERPDSNEHRQTELYSVSNISALRSGFDVHGTGKTQCLSKDERTEASETTDITSEHTEPGITNEIKVTKTAESAKHVLQRAHDKRELTGASIALDVCSEINTYCGSNVSEKVTSSSVTDDCTNQGDSETQIIEEDITVKMSMEDELDTAIQMCNVRLPSDVTVDCEPEADDSEREVISPRGEKNTLYDSELDSTSCENRSGVRKEFRKDIYKNSQALGKTTRGSWKSSFWSKLFSCVSPRNTNND